MPGPDQYGTSCAASGLGTLSIVTAADALCGRTVDLASERVRAQDSQDSQAPTIRGLQCVSLNGVVETSTPNILDRGQLRRYRRNLHPRLSSELHHPM